MFGLQIFEKVNGLEVEDLLFLCIPSLFPFGKAVGGFPVFLMPESFDNNPQSAIHHKAARGQYMYTK